MSGLINGAFNVFVANIEHSNAQPTQNQHCYHVDSVGICTMTLIIASTLTNMGKVDLLQGIGPND